MSGGILKRSTSSNGHKRGEKKKGKTEMMIMIVIYFIVIEVVRIEVV